MNEFEQMVLSTETLRCLTDEELAQVAGGAPPSEVNCRPLTDTCHGLTVLCWTSGGPACVDA